jgi:hypothetical protein
MATKRKQSAKKKSSTKSRDARKSVEKKDVAAAEEKFVSDLLIRGEAALPDRNGNLPSNATHEILEEKDGELPIVERRIFKIW